MGELCLIVNHTQKLYIDPTMKFRELLLNHYGDYLIHLLNSTTWRMKNTWYQWGGDDIEVISQSDMKKYELILTHYTNITKDLKELFADAIGVNA